MAHWTQESDLPWIELAGGMILEFVALDPDSAGEVADVSVANIAIYSQDLGDDGGVVERIIPSLAFLPDEE